jgi:ribosome-associated translation inhibitor RaiA
MELGGNIELVDFKDLEPAEMIVLKKIIGNYARKFSDHVENYEKLSLHLKKAEGKHKFEVYAKLLHNQKSTNSEVTGTNLFIAVSDALKKVEHQLFK